MKKTENYRFTPYSIIKKKRCAEKLTAEEIKWFISELTAKRVDDAQMAALLMAIFINGFDKAETAALTDAMLYSGQVLDFKDQTVIDKHSTGGIGDKTSFIIAPIAAACGVKVPMIAGRGLGHTGGTVDKIESIEGFNTSVSMDDFKKLLYKNGLVLIGQTKEIAPADKKIYSLRDVTATVESIPLITASIMSKKLAEGTSGMVLDVKAGNGAFMKSKAKAKALGKSLSDTGLRFNKNMMTFITDMSQPLGKAVGNSLEIIESIETLKGKGPKDLTDLCLELAGGMIYLAGLSKSHKEGINKAKKSIEDGSALSKFKIMLEAQGGSSKYVDDYSHFPLAKIKTEVPASKTGFISLMQNEKIGLLCLDLGGGRKVATDKIDFAVGFIFHKRLGQNVKKGESLLTIFHHEHQQDQVNKMLETFNNEVIIIKKDKPTKLQPLIMERNVSWSK